MMRCLSHVYRGFEYVTVSVRITLKSQFFPFTFPCVLEICVMEMKRRGQASEEKLSPLSHLAVQGKFLCVLSLKFGETKKYSKLLKYIKSIIYSSDF